MHGPFTRGKDAMMRCITLLFGGSSQMAYRTLTLNADIGPMDRALLDKHFLRKHGANAYYGQ